MCACGGGSSSGSGPTPAATPTITATPAQNGAQMVSISESTPAATIYYTLDGTTPTTSSQIYQAPFLVAANLTVKAIASAPANSASSVDGQGLHSEYPLRYADMERRIFVSRRR